MSLCMRRRASALTSSAGEEIPMRKSKTPCVGCSLAYFVYDAICCELIKHELANLLHHIATIVGLTVGVFRKVVRCCRSAPVLSHTCHTRTGTHA